MAIFRFSNAGGFGTYQRYNDFLAGNPTTPVITDFGSMFPLGEFTLASAQSSVTFSNIPQTYTHLQVRGYIKAVGDWSFKFNSDSGTNYNAHLLYGTGASAISNNLINFARGYIGYGDTGTEWGSFVLDILDYKNTNKFTTTRSLAGYDANGSGFMMLNSSAWRNTAAVSNIEVYSTGGNLPQYSSFALYGIL